MARRPLVRTALLLVPFQVVRAGEALLPVFVARWFGATAEADAYVLALTTFTFVAGLAFGVFRDSVLVPMLAEVRVRTPEQVPAVVGALLAHTLVWGSALAALVGVAAHVGFHACAARDEAAVAATMVLPFAPWLVAVALKSFFGAVLAAHHRYVPQPVAAGLGVGVTLGVLALLRRWGVLAVPTAMLAGELTGAAALGWVAFALERIPFRLSLERPEPFRRFVVLALPDVLGGAVTRVNPAVAVALATAAWLVGATPEGSRLILKTSADVADFPSSVVQAALLPVLLTHLSYDLAEERTELFRSTVIRAVAATACVLGAVALGIFVARGALLGLVFGGDEMSPAAVRELAAILPYHLAGLPFFGALLVLARAHIALKNTRIMLPIGVLNAALHAVLCLALGHLLGLRGIALAASIVNVVVVAAFWALLEVKLREEPA